MIGFFLLVYRFFPDLFLFSTVCAFTTGYLDIDYNYTVRCCPTYEYVFVYTCHIFLLLLLLCVAILLLLPLQCCCLLLLAAAVRHRVPDDIICCCGLMHVIPVFSSFKHDFFFMYPLALLSHEQPRLTYNTHRTSSKITGMRGAKAGVSPPRRIPPCKCNYRYVGHYVGYVVSAIEKSDLDQVLRRRRPSSR